MRDQKRETRSEKREASRSEQLGQVAGGARRSYRDLDVWKRSMQLSVGVYKLTQGFPREEIYGLTSQLRRASVSVVSNIAEGHGRGATPQLLHFLAIARGSIFEVEAQLALARELGFGDAEAISQCESLCDEVSRMLRSMMRALKEQTVV